MVLNMDNTSSSYIARGLIRKVPCSNQYGIIEIDSHEIEVPEFLYLFWEQFRVAANFFEAKELFCASGLDEELFDESLEILADLGLIVRLE